MKKLIKVVLIIVVVLCIMFAEYRYIMTHIRPYHGEDGTVYLEVFNQVDEYHAEYLEE